MSLSVAQQAALLSALTTSTSAKLKEQKEASSKAAKEKAAKSASSESSFWRQIVLYLVPHTLRLFWYFLCLLASNLKFVLPVAVLFSGSAGWRLFITSVSSITDYVFSTMSWDKILFLLAMVCWFFPSIRTLLLQCAVQLRLVCISIYQAPFWSLLSREVVVYGVVCIIVTLTLFFLERKGQHIYGDVSLYVSLILVLLAIMQRQRLSQVFMMVHQMPLWSHFTWAMINKVLMFLLVAFALLYLPYSQDPIMLLFAVFLVLMAATQQQWQASQGYALFQNLIQHQYVLISIIAFILMMFMIGALVELII